MSELATVDKESIKVLVSELENRFGERIQIVGQNSGLYILICFQTKYSEAELIQKAKNHGVKVYPTSVYYITGKSDEVMIKLGFSNCSVEEIQQGVSLLYEAWK